MLVHSELLGQGLQTSPTALVLGLGHAESTHGSGPSEHR